MKTVPANGVMTSGIDLSHYTPQVNWDIVKAAGIAFAYIKASEGSTNRDPSFQKLWAAGKAAGITCGAYHYFHPSQDPETQATNFIKAIGQLSVDDLPPVLDLESLDSETSKLAIGRAQVFLAAIQKATGKVPVIYGSPSFLEALKFSKDITKYPLWIAHYGVSSPSVPTPFTGWSFWQYSENAAMPGVSQPGTGRVDASYFNGTSADLKAFVAASNLPSIASALPKA